MYKFCVHMFLFMNSIMFIHLCTLFIRIMHISLYVFDRYRTPRQKSGSKYCRVWVPWKYSAGKMNRHNYCIPCDLPFHVDTKALINHTESDDVARNLTADGGRCYHGNGYAFITVVFMSLQ